MTRRPRADRVILRAVAGRRWVTPGRRWVTARRRWVTARRRWVTARRRWISHDSPGKSLLFVSPAGLRRGSSLTSQKRLARFVVPTMGGPRTTFAGGRSPRSFEVVLASSGRRGRDDARGQQAHTPSGMTRTSHRDADAPSRDQRRGRSPRKRRHHRASCVITVPRANSVLTVPTASSPRQQRQYRANRFANAPTASPTRQPRHPARSRRIHAGERRCLRRGSCDCAQDDGRVQVVHHEKVAAASRSAIRVKPDGV